MAWLETIIYRADRAKGIAIGKVDKLLVDKVLDGDIDILVIQDLVNIVSVEPLLPLVCFRLPKREFHRGIGLVGKDIIVHLEMLEILLGFACATCSQSLVILGAPLGLDDGLDVGNDVGKDDDGIDVGAVGSGDGTEVG